MLLITKRVLTLFKMRGGKKTPPLFAISFSPVNSTNVGISP